MTPSARFRPGWPATVLTLVLLPVLVALGFWQLARADYKRDLARAYAERERDTPVTVEALSDPDPSALAGRQVVLTGRFDPALRLLLDNQMRAGRPGYAVVEPFVPEGSGSTVLVSRGWIDAGSDRAHLPDIASVAGTVVVTGRLRPPYRPAFSPGADALERRGGRLVRAVAVDPRRLGELLGRPLPPIVVELGPDSPGVLAPIDVSLPMDADRHVAYAVQWFAIAATLLIVYLAHGVRRASLDDAAT